MFRLNFDRYSAKLSLVLSKTRENRIRAVFLTEGRDVASQLNSHPVILLNIIELDCVRKVYVIYYYWEGEREKEILAI